jgi:transcription elongation factor Elf1
MAAADVWQSIEGKLKSLTSTLQSLPNDVRTMALEYISKQMAPEHNGAAEDLPNGEKLLMDTGTESETDATTAAIQPSDGNTSEMAVDKRPKRGRPPGNRNVIRAVSPPSATRVSKRIQSRGSSLKFHRWLDEDYSPGRTAKAASRRSVAEKCGRKTTKEELGDNEKALLIDEKPRRKYRKRNVSSPDEKPANSPLTIVVKPEPASNDDDNNDLEIDAQPADDNDVEAVDDAEDSVLVAEALSDTQSMLIDKLLLPPRKRGRPSKKALKEMEELGISPPSEQATKGRKAIGRPRFSSYPSGYVPKTKCYTCNICHKMLASRQSFREHSRRHTGEYFVCDLCGQKFTTNSGFLMHKKYHSDDPNVFKCTICQYSVRSQELLDEHYQNRHDPNRPREHICYICGKGFHMAIQLEKHLVCHETNKPYKCDECDFATAYPDGLAKHKYNVHETVGRKLFQCQLCNVQLRSKGTYVEHIGRHFNQRKKRCDVCNKTFPTASQLAAHRRIHADPKVPCEVCGKLLRNKHKLKVHLLVHSGQKDFACPYCNYVTYVKHNLKKHCVARHKVIYPPIERPHMKKFSADNTSIDTSSVTDPVARQCITKILDETSDNPMLSSPDDADAGDSAVGSDPISATHPPAVETVAVTSLPSQDSAVDHSPNGSQTHEKVPLPVLSASKGMKFEHAAVTSDVSCVDSGEIPQPTILISGTEVYSVALPVISVPLVAYGMPGSFTRAGGDVVVSGSSPHLDSAGGTTYVALAAAPVSAAGQFGASQPTGRSIVVPVQPQLNRR